MQHWRRGGRERERWRKGKRKRETERDMEKGREEENERREGGGSEGEREREQYITDQAVKLLLAWDYTLESHTVPAILIHFKVAWDYGCIFWNCPA